MARRQSTGRGKSRRTQTGWIQRAIQRPGAFRAKAKKAGMSTMAFARKVTASPSRYDARTVRQARLAQTLMGFQRRRR
jgi:hypothetical protein